MVMFTLSVFEWEYPFYDKLVSKSKLFAEAEIWNLD